MTAPKNVGRIWTGQKGCCRTGDVTFRPARTRETADMENERWIRLPGRIVSIILDSEDNNGTDNGADSISCWCL